MATQGTSGENILEAFVDQLVEEKGMGNLNAEVLHQVKSDLLSRLEDRINAALVGALPADKFEGAEKAIESGDSAKMQEYFAKNVQNLDELVAMQLVEFRQTYIS